jgi:hypothetical protein
MFQQNLGLSRAEEQKSRRRPDDAESSTRVKISLEPHWEAMELLNWRLADLSERLISAYEGMARAHAVAREYPLTREFISKAREQLRSVSLDDEDRKTYSDQIDETERMIPK